MTEKHRDELDACVAGDEWLEAIIASTERHPSDLITTEKVGNDGAVKFFWHHNKVRAAFITVRDDWNFTQLLRFEAPDQPDIRAICETLGFDPTNHHNAAKCPYCTPPQSEFTIEGD